MPKRNKVYTYKRVVTVFIIAMFSIVFFEFCVNRIIYNYFRDEIKNTEQIGLVFFTKSLQDKFLYINKVQKNLSEDVDVQKFVYINDELSDYEKSDVINEISDELKKIASLGSSIKECGAYLSPQNIVITNTSYVTKDDQAKIDTIKGYSKNSNVGFSKDGRDLVLYTAHTSNGHENPDLVFYTKFNTEFIVNELYSISKQSQIIFTSRNFDIAISEDMDSEVIEYLKSNQAAGLFYSSDNTEIELNNQRYLITFVPISEFGLYVFSVVKSSMIDSQLQKINLFFFLLLLGSCIIIFAFSRRMRDVIYNPIDKMLTAFERLDKGDLTVVIETEKTDGHEFNILYTNFNYMVMGLKNSLNQTYVQLSNLRKSEFKQLQLQIHPHFLYNCFFNISNLINLNEVQKAKLLTKQLGNYYKYITKDAIPSIRFVTEYEHMCTYIDINKIRYGDRFIPHISPLPEEVKELTVPKIILQPIVENALKYGLDNMIEPMDFYFDVSASQDIMTLTFQDNGQSITDEQICFLNERLNDYKSVDSLSGLLNVNVRLKMQNSNKSGITLFRSEYGGLKVVMRIGCEDFENLQAAFGR